MPTRPHTGALGGLMAGAQGNSRLGRRVGPAKAWSRRRTKVDCDERANCSGFRTLDDLELLNGCREVRVRNARSGDHVRSPDGSGADDQPRFSVRAGCERSKPEGETGLSDGVASPRHRAERRKRDEEEWASHPALSRGGQLRGHPGNDHQQNEQRRQPRHASSLRPPPTRSSVILARWRIRADMPPRVAEPYDPRAGR